MKRSRIDALLAVERGGAREELRGARGEEEEMCGPARFF
jgi:hypothetical protein